MLSNIIGAIIGLLIIWYIVIPAALFCIIALLTVPSWIYATLLIGTGVAVGIYQEFIQK